MTVPAVLGSSRVTVADLGRAALAGGFAIVVFVGASLAVAAGARFGATAAAAAAGFVRRTVVGAVCAGGAVRAGGVLRAGGAVSVGVAFVGSSCISDGNSPWNDFPRAVPRETEAPPAPLSPAEPCAAAAAIEQARHITTEQNLRRILSFDEILAILRGLTTISLRQCRG